MSMLANATFAALAIAGLVTADVSERPASPAAPKAAAAQPDLERSMVVSETPSELQLPLWPWWPYGGAGDVCATFVAHGLGVGARSVSVTTAGLGGAELHVISTPQELGEPCAGSTWKPFLWLVSIGPSRTWLRVRVPRAAFPVPGSTLSGKIRFAVASRAPYDVAVQLSTPPPGPFWTALLWFAGLLIPACVGYRFFVWQEAKKAENAENAAFEAFKASNVAKLNNRFSAWYPGMIANVQHEDHWRAKLLIGLNDDGIIQALRSRDRDRLMQAIDGATPAQITKELGAIFPVWKSFLLLKDEET